jgi:uncharacterized protein YprB with RNaseH-like and TPR domain
MNLRDKISRRRTGASPPAAPEPDRPASAPEDKNALLESLRQRMSQIQDGKTARSTLPTQPLDVDADHRLASGHLLPGQERKTPQGSVWIRNQVFAPDFCYGQAQVGGFHSAREALFALARDERLEGFDPKRCLFLDLETTGLDRGAGTLAFLIGVGWFDDDGSLNVELMFCREPSEEPAALGRLTEHLSRAGALVTFNGRSFDVPLINTRFVLHRMKNPGWSLPHLDLLLAARRVFKRRLKDCSLGHLERAVLGFERQGDIPSSAIPQTYIDFLHGRDRGAMSKVLEHNILDIVALAALGGELGKLYLDPTAVSHAIDHLGLASMALRAGDAESAGSHLVRAMDGGEELTAAEAALWSGRAAARHKDYEKAIELYLRAVKLDNQCGAAHLALAKLHEHVRKDTAQALVHAQAACEWEGEELSARRIARLQRKLGL